jgi:hypothetical protein
MISFLSIDANAPLIAMKFSPRTQTGKETIGNFILTERSAQVLRGGATFVLNKRHERHGDPTLGRSHRKLEPRQAQ